LLLLLQCSRKFASGSIIYSLIATERCRAFVERVVGGGVPARRTVCLSVRVAWAAAHFQSKEVVDATNLETSFHPD
jgi:hypothetical protein